VILVRKQTYDMITSAKFLQHWDPAEAEKGPTRFHIPSYPTLKLVGLDDGGNELEAGGGAERVSVAGLDEIQVRQAVLILAVDVGVRQPARDLREGPLGSTPEAPGHSTTLAPDLPGPSSIATHSSRRITTHTQRLIGTHHQWPFGGYTRRPIVSTLSGSWPS
jgi:hypothetical protein